jgi:hypothetical protein
MQLDLQKSINEKYISSFPKYQNQNPNINLVELISS